MPCGTFLLIFKNGSLKDYANWSVCKINLWGHKIILTISKWFGTRDLWKGMLKGFSENIFENKFFTY